MLERLFLIRIIHPSGVYRESEVAQTSGFRSWFAERDGSDRACGFDDERSHLRIREIFVPHAKFGSYGRLRGVGKKNMKWRAVDFDERENGGQRDRWNPRQ